MLLSFPLVCVGLYAVPPLVSPSFHPIESSDGTRSTSFLSVQNRLSDMYFLRTKVRHSRSFTLSIGFLLEYSPSFTYPIRHFPYVTTWSIDQICNSVLIRLLLPSICFPLTPFGCSYMLLFHCINSRPSWPSEI